jgi:hypothetical protein
VCCLSASYIPSSKAWRHSLRLRDKQQKGQPQEDSQHIAHGFASLFGEMWATNIGTLLRLLLLLPCSQNHRA